MCSKKSVHAQFLHYIREQFPNEIIDYKMLNLNKNNTTIKATNVSLTQVQLQVFKF